MAWKRLGVASVAAAYGVMACSIMAQPSPATAHFEPFPHPPKRVRNATILDLNVHNPSYDTSDPNWARNVCGGSVWLHGSSPKFEWTPVLDPGQAVESRVVAVAGRVLTPLARQESTEDVWFTHPFAADKDPSKGGDLDVDVAWSSDPNQDFIATPTGSDAESADNVAEAAKLGIQNPRFLHIESDSQFIPPPFRGDAGASMAIFGRWIVDCGHNNFQSEIHPPLMAVTAAADPNNYNATIATVIGRPFLVDQIFDGKGLYDHLISEAGTEAGKSLIVPGGLAILGDKFDARVGVETMPFKGLQWMMYYVRPPVLPAAGQILQVTYDFRVRSGVVVQLTNANDGKGSVLVSVLMNDLGYHPATLPKREDWGIPLSNIKAQDGLGPYILGAQFGAAFIGNPAMAHVLQKGVTAIWYQLPTPTGGAPATVLASNIRGNTPVTVDDSQPFPIVGHMTVRWVDTLHPPTVYVPTPH
jgi:hypothetical protein